MEPDDRAQPDDQDALLPGTLDELLREPVGAGDAGQPQDIPSPSRMAAVRGGAVLVLFAALPVVAPYWTVPLHPNVLTFEIGVAGVAASFLPNLFALRQRFRISEEGIRREAIAGDSVTGWWTVQRVQMAGDLRSMTVDATSGQTSIDLRRLPPGERVRVARAVRTHLSGYGRDIEPRRGRRWNPAAVVQRVARTGSILLVAWSAVAGFGGSLGIRCSGPSSYFDARFGLPPGQSGCVVLRVSGAAKRAGVRQGDRMVWMNGAPITSGAQFNDRFLTDADESSGFDFTFVRSGVIEPINIHVRLDSGSPPSTPDSDPLAWFLRARGNPNVQQAIDQYTRAIQLAPDFDLAYVFRGQLEWDQRNLVAAVADYKKTLELNPNSAEANRGLADYYNGQPYIDAAVPKMYVQRAIELDHCQGGFTDQNLDCEIDYIILADVLRVRTDALGAIDAAQQAMLFYPKSPDPLYQLAAAYALLGDKAQAAAYARQYLARPALDRTDSHSQNMRTLISRAQTPAATP